MKRLFVLLVTMAILLSVCACTGTLEPDQRTTIPDPRLTDTKEEVLSESETQSASVSDNDQSRISTTTTMPIPTTSRPTPTTTVSVATTKKPSPTTTKQKSSTTTIPTSTTRPPITTTKATPTTTTSKNPNSNITPELQEKLDTLKTCKFCGRKKGYGNNGTCARFPHEMDCPRCGVHVQGLTCHTCG